MTGEGFISVHRCIKDNWLWKDKPFSKGQAWIDLLLSANHQDNKILFDGELIVVRRGSFITSIRKLSDKWGWSKDKVSKFLAKLELDEMLLKNSNNKRTLLTIVNYDVYQTTKDTNKDTKRTLTRTQTGTNNNDNNENNNISKDILVKKVFDHWNALGLSRLISMNGNRKKLFNARVKEVGEDNFIKAIDSIKESSFLRGQNQRGWVITFDWFVKPSNFQKVMEGNYLDKKSDTSYEEDILY